MAATDNPASRKLPEALIPTTFQGLPILGRPMKVSVGLPRAPGLDRLRLIVEAMLYGGSLEHVTVFHKGKPTDLFVCEGSSFVGNARNDKATKIYRASALERDPTTAPESLPAIYGPAVIVDRRVWF